MAYRVLKGSVSKHSVVPEEYVEPPEPVQVETRSPPAVIEGPVCPHGYRIRTACYACNYATVSEEPSHKVADKRAAAYLLSPPTTLHSVDSMFEDIPVWSRNLRVGDKVCRRIRRDHIGVVESIEYVFTNSEQIRDIWVKFEGWSRGTPYTPDELLRLKVQ